MMPNLGHVAFMSQSGALCTAVLDYAHDLKVGFSKFASLGNKAGVDELELIKYLAQDDQTKVILIYAESLTNAPEFIKTLKQINRGSNPKPVIMLKSGRTEAGASAVASHTGSLAGGDAAYQALFKQAGVIRANSIRELFDLAAVFANNPLKPVKDIAIITNAGGPGVITTDEAVAQGLKLAELSANSKQKLKENLPSAASVSNPIDVLGDAKADRYQIALETAAADKNVDAVQVLLTPQSMTEVAETAQAIVNLKQQTTKPLAASFMGGPTVKPGFEILDQAGVAATFYPEPGAKGLACLGQFARWSELDTEQTLSYDDVNHDQAAEIFAQAQEQNQTKFPEAEALEILKAYNFPLLKYEIVTGLDQVRSAAAKIGQKMAMKIISPDILHKSDVGGVKLNVTINNAEAKFKEMMAAVTTNAPEAELKGVLLMEMASDQGQELIVGVNHAPGLGPMVMVGLGGIYVEVLQDVSFAFAPITHREAETMIADLKTAELLTGTRGQKPKDQAAVIECIGRLAQLVTDFPQIKEVDINPLMVFPQGQGAKVLDARIIIE